MKLKSLIVGIFIIICGNILSQSKLSGLIYDEVNNQPLIGAVVFVKELGKGTITDVEGNYTITLLKGEYTVEISYLGYISKEEHITIANKNIRRNFHLRTSSKDLYEVVITANGAVQSKREQPFQISVLDAKPLQIQSQPVTGLINQISGVRVREEGGMGSNVNIMLNGISGKGIRIFVDDIPADLLGNGMAISNLPVNMIDHIEVYKGVVPARFGSDALGGVLNIVTRNVKKDYLDISAGTSSFGTYQGSLNSRKYFGIDKKYHLGLSGFYNHSDNDYRMDDMKIIVDEMGNTENKTVRRFNDAYTSYLGRLTSGVKNLTWANEIKLNLSASHTYKEWQHGLTANIPWGETFSEQTDINSELKWKKYRIWNNKLDASLNAGYNYIKYNFTDTASRTYYWGAANGIAPYIESEPGETGYYTNGRNPVYYKNNGFARLNLVYHLHNKHKLNLTSQFTRVHIKGHDYRGIETFGADILANPQTLNKIYTGLALESKFWNSRMTNIFSVKNFYGHSKVVAIEETLISKGEEENSYSKFGYGDALKIQLVSGLFATLNYEYTLRMPDEEELFGDFITVFPNADLEPEESHNASIGFRYHTSGKNFSANINGFYRNTSNLIFLNSLTLFRSVYMNLLATETWGSEGEIRFNPLKSLGVYANLTWQDIRLKETDPNGNIDERYVGTHIPNTPWLFGNAGVNYTLPYHIGERDKIQLYYTCNYVHDFYLSWEIDGIKSTKATIPQQIVHNGGVSYVFDNERLSLSFESRNFTDERIYDNYMVQKPGRSFYIKMRFFLEK